MSEAARKIAVIVALDVAGYSARTEADEARATAEVAGLRGVIEGIAKRHAGRVFNTAGDGFMLEFGSSLAAVEAALALAEACEPKVRVGVHLGDVVVQPNGDLLGHGVNVAARLMAKSDPGGALVSAAVRQTIRGPIAERLVSRGVLQLDKMAEAIEAFAFGAVSSDVGAPLKSKTPFLAVLPFENLSDDRAMQFFSDGVSEEILQAVARAKGLKVAGRGSSFQYRGANKAPGKIARELGATHVLDGSVRRSGDHIRVSAHLVETSSQATVWTERYDRALTDILKLQDELASAIALALNSTLIKERTAPSIDPAAFDLYLRARALLAGNWIDLERRQAVAILEQAVARAPEFARAWGTLAYVRGLLDDSQRSDDYRASVAAANRALTLDPNCAEGYAALSLAKPAFSDHAEKRRLAAKALELAPNDAFIWAFEAQFAASVGHTRDCAHAYGRSAELEPAMPIFRAGQAVYLSFAGREREGAAVAADLWHKHPDSAVIWFARLITLLLVDRQSGLEMLSPSSPFPNGVERAGMDWFLTLLRLEERPRAERQAMVQAMLTSGPVLSLQRCVFAANAGDAELAYQHLFSALDADRLVGDDTIAGFGLRRAAATASMFNGFARKFRRDTRFPVLCHRLNLVDYWMTSGQWPDCVNEVPYDFKAECEKAAREVVKA